MEGGVALSQGNPSCLRFSLEESIWFQRGQEVLELISISLDPDILIQENDQYVTIQGALELSGEYKRNEIDALEDEAIFAAPKFIQLVEEREEGICEFNHFFPVDITIPKNRIENIRDIDVKVESFDYVFPERSCLKLSANLMITGLYEEQRATFNETEIEKEEDSLHRSSVAVTEVDVATFAKPSLVEMEEENDRLVLAIDEEIEEEETVEIHIPFHAEARKQPETDVKETEFPNEMKAEDYVEVEPEISFIAQKMVPSLSDHREEKAVIVEKPIQNVEVVEEKHIQEESSSDEEELKSSFKDKKKATEKKKKKSKKKSMSLTEFFARKEEEEAIAKLKVCIVQHGDTIDLIAERYDISVQQLLRVNQMEINQDIHEGQVLYIPVAVAH